MERVPGGTMGWKSCKGDAEATRIRVTAEGLSTLAGQERIYDSDTFNSWLSAKLGGRRRQRNFSSGVFATSIGPLLRPGLARIRSIIRKRLPVRFSCPTITM